MGVFGVVSAAMASARTCGTQQHKVDGWVGLSLSAPPSDIQGRAGGEAYHWLGWFRASSLALDVLAKADGTRSKLGPVLEAA